MQYRDAEVYATLMRAAAETLQTFARKRWDADLGIVAVLHTWGQTLQLHPHVHCLVTGGALKRDGSAFVQAPKNFRFPVRALSRVFRAICLRELEHLRGARKLTAGPPELADDDAFKQLMLRRHRHAWVGYAERPFAEPQDLIRYLGRYVNRLRQANHRIVAIDDPTVTCRYRDGLQGPQGTGSGEAQAPAGHRHHPPLPSARLAARIPPDPLLRPARRRAAPAAARAMPRAAWPRQSRRPLHRRPRRLPRQAGHRTPVCAQPACRIGPASSRGNRRAKSIGQTGAQAEVEAFLFISVLAYHFVHTLRLQFKAARSISVGTASAARWKGRIASTSRPSAPTDAAFMYAPLNS